MKIDISDGKISGTNAITILQQAVGYFVDGSFEMNDSESIHIFEIHNKNYDLLGIKFAVFGEDKNSMIHVDIFFDQDYKIEDGEIIFDSKDIMGICPVFPIGYKPKEMYEEGEYKNVAN